jgi:exopolyphosphatase/guanosine-5'-triphosphate,3'-diphosphate pyrophosphatase
VATSRTADPNIAWAIDLGSNAVRLSIARRGKAGEPAKELVSERAPIRLGHDVFANGRVSPASQAALEKAFASFSRAIRAHRAGLGRAVATSALREAKNGQQVAGQLSKLIPAPLELISGMEEARFIRLAVQRKLNLAAQGRVLMVEVGGGSAEVSFLDRGEFKWAECLKIGAVRLLEVLGSGPSGGQRFEALVGQYCDRVLTRLRQHLPSGRINLLVGTGGNVEALAELGQRLAHSRRLAGGAVRLTLPEFDKVFGELENLSVEGRIHRLGLRPDRADVILPAAVVYRELMRSLRQKAVVVPFASLRQGLLESLFEQHLPGAFSPELALDIREAGSQHARRYHVEMGHALQVQRLALELFDQLKPLHGLDGADRLILELAALLHDCGYAIAAESHHKHSYYLISQAMDFPGLSQHQHEMLALVARYHRRSHPQLEHKPFADLPRAERGKVLRLSALLRLADALDRGHKAAVRQVRVVDRGKVLELTARGRGNLGLESWSLQKKAALFDQVFKRRVALKTEGGL